GVRRADFLDRAVGQAVHRRTGEDRMDAAGVALGRPRLDADLCCLGDRARGIDLVVDDDRLLALHRADQVQHLRLVLVPDATLLDDRQRTLEDVGEIPRALRV